MTALDTNVLVRFFTRDSIALADLAARLIADRPVFIAVTVLLETEWVLRGRYRIDRRAILEIFAEFAGLSTVTLQHRDVVERAMQWSRDGMEFADAIHLGFASLATAFATFDERLAKRSAALRTKPQATHPAQLEPLAP